MNPFSSLPVLIALLYIDHAAFHFLHVIMNCFEKLCCPHFFPSDGIDSFWMTRLSSMFRQIDFQGSVLKFSKMIKELEPGFEALSF